MQYLANAKEAKRIDGISIEKIGIPSCVLMERASLKTADAICRLAPKEAKKVLILCGTGNNGGDGVACGRILADRGYEVVLVLLGNEENASEELKIQLTIAQNLSLPIIKNPSFEEMKNENYSILVDAIFGIGLSREITGEYASWIEWMNQLDAVTFSIDIPSGIDASSGKVLGKAVKADYTITFGVNKIGLVLFPGMIYAGKVIVEDIGFPKKAMAETNFHVMSYEKEDIIEEFPKRIPNSNKGSYGKLLVIAGSETISGAAFFTAKAAYLMGSGLVHVISHENNRSMLQTNIPEAIFTFYQSMNANSKEYTKFIESIENVLSRVTAVVIGPGLGQSDFAKDLLKKVIEIGGLQNKLPVLIDADGLNLLSKMDEYFEKDKKITLPSNFVLTPHLKEMSRMTALSVQEIKTNIISVASEKTDTATIVLKDARTVISNGTDTIVNCSGNNALAKGGSGDVLSGMIGGLLARNVLPVKAAALGVYLHGLTAEEYVKDRSSSSMLATDILEYIPHVLP